MQEPTVDNCHDAIKWISTLLGTGSTCTLEALQVSRRRDVSVDQTDS